MASCIHGFIPQVGPMWQNKARRRNPLPRRNTAQFTLREPMQNSSRKGGLSNAAYVTHIPAPIRELAATAHFCSATPVASRASGASSYPSSAQSARAPAAPEWRGERTGQPSWRPWLQQSASGRACNSRRAPRAPSLPDGYSARCAGAGMVQEVGASVLRGALLPPAQLTPKRYFMKTCSTNRWDKRNNQLRPTHTCTPFLLRAASKAPAGCTDTDKDADADTDTSTGTHRGTSTRTSTKASTNKPRHAIPRHATRCKQKAASHGVPETCRRHKHEQQMKAPRIQCTRVPWLRTMRGTHAHALSR